MLVIDDNSDLAEALATGLGMLGYQVQTASCGLTGLETAVTFKPHAAIIDISLPMLDGWSLAERISTNPLFRKPRLIALTGLCETSHRVKSAASGFHHHVVKPISLARLDALISD